MKNCKKCGKRISNNGNFCPHCGAAIDNSIEEDSINNSKVKPLSLRNGILITVIFLGIIIIATVFILGIKEKSTSHDLTGNFEMRDENGNVLITIEDIYSAEIEKSPGENDEQVYQILLQFTDEGTSKFADITAKLFEEGEKLYVYLDNQCINTATINSVFTDGIICIKRCSSHKDAELILSRLYGIENNSIYEAEDSDAYIADDAGTFNENTKNTENDLNIMDYHYAIKRIYYYGNEEAFIPEDEQFWVKADYTSDDGNSFTYYVLTDTAAHIYEIIDGASLNMSNALDVIISLPDRRTALGYTETIGHNRKYNYKIFADVDSDLNDISDQFLEEDETIWNILKDDFGIRIFTYKTIETYSYQDIIINVYDEYWDKKLTFSKSELSDKYDFGSMSIDKLYLTSIGGNIYYMMPNGSNNTLFFDTMRNKVFIINTTTDTGIFSSDGNYIICSGLDTVIIDIDNELEILNTSGFFDGFRFEFGGYESYMWRDVIEPYVAEKFSEIREGKFFGKAYDNHYGLFDYSGAAIAVLDYEDSTLSNYSSFYNGYAVLELENSGGTKFVTIIDDKGNWLFDPIKGNLGDRTYYFENLDCFLIFSDDETGGYLLNSQGVQQQLSNISSEYGSFFHLTNINGEPRIMYLDSQSGMLLYTQEIISAKK